MDPAFVGFNNISFTAAGEAPGSARRGNALPPCGAARCIRSPEHPCQNHNNVCVPRAYDDQSIHGKTIITFVFLEHTMTRASMPKP